MAKIMEWNIQSGGGTRISSSSDAISSYRLEKYPVQLIEYG
jgi:hypothetical protein